MAIIMHVDMNSYFASAEQQANPFLRGKAIGVTGKRKERSVVAAASREAKLRGVKTAMATWQALQILPSIILVPGDPEKYSYITNTFNRIFIEESDAVQRFSVDESFLDVTQASGGDYFGAIAIALRIKDRLRKECGSYITASIGIGPNKVVAKLASERIKPDGLTVIPPHQAISLIDQCELQDLCGIGPRTTKHLEALGIYSFPQLRAYPVKALEAEFHSYGRWLHEAAHGRGDDIVCSDETPQRSYGHSYTLPQNTDDVAVAERYLLGLCEKVAWRMRRDGFLTRTVASYVRFGDFSGAGGQVTLDEPSADGWKLFLAARSILVSTDLFPKSHHKNTSQVIGPLPLRPHNPEFHNQTTSPLQYFTTPTPLKPIRLVGISATSLVPGHEPLPLTLKDRKLAHLLPALDKLQTRYGDRAWTRASLLRTEVLARTSGFAYDHEI